MIYVAGGIFAAVATRLLRLLVCYHTESAADFSSSKHERVGLSGEQESCVIGMIALLAGVAPSSHNDDCLLTARSTWHL